VVHPGVPFLALHHIRAQIHRIVGKDLLDLLRCYAVAGDVGYIRFIPIETKSSALTPVYIRRMYPAKN
jgi:hypothetical protein